MSRSELQNVVLFLVRIVPQGQGEVQHGRGARSGHHLSGDNDNGSQRHLKDENKLIYSVRGIHCKSFNHPDESFFQIIYYLSECQAEVGSEAGCEDKRGTTSV